MATVPVLDASTATTVVIAALDTLPHAAISGAGLVSQAFRARGLSTLRDACAWVQALPYGCHAGSPSSLIIFEEGCGNCSTKHGAIARLAGELGVDMRKYVGVYRLDDAMAPGVGALLAPHGLTFVPYMHCFLQHRGATIDLTHDNQTGKTRTPDTFDHVAPVPAEATRDEMKRIYDEQLARYAAADAGLAAVDRTRLSELVLACAALMNTRCDGQTGCCG